MIFQAFLMKCHILSVLGQLTHAKHKNLTRIQNILANIKHISGALRMDITFYSVEAVNIWRGIAEADIKLARLNKNNIHP